MMKKVFTAQDRKNVVTPMHTLKQTYLTSTCETLCSAKDGSSTRTLDYEQGQAHISSTVRFLLQTLIVLVLSFAVLGLSGLGNDAWAYSGGSGTKDDPYQIANVSDLQELADVVNTDRGNQKGVYFKQTENISLASAPNFYIGYPSTYSSPGNTAFAGNYDGNDCIISDWSFDVSKARFSGSVYATGLFGSLNGATLSNITLDNARLYGSLDSLNRDAFMGVLVGNTFASTITGCNVTNASVDVKRTAAFPSSYNYTVGVIAADAFQNNNNGASKIDHCSVWANVKADIAPTAFTVTTAPGSVQFYAGGCVGRVRINANKAAAPTVTSVENSFFSGTVQGNGYVSPFVAATRWNDSKLGELGLDANLVNCCFNQPNNDATALLSKTDGSQPDSILNPASNSANQPNGCSLFQVKEENGATTWEYNPTDTNGGATFKYDLDKNVSFYNDTQANNEADDSIQKALLAFPEGWRIAQVKDNGNTLYIPLSARGEGSNYISRIGCDDGYWYFASGSINAIANEVCSDVQSLDLSAWHAVLTDNEEAVTMMGLTTEEKAAYGSNAVKIPVQAKQTKLWIDDGTNVVGPCVFSGVDNLRLDIGKTINADNQTYTFAADWAQIATGLEAADFSYQWYYHDGNQFVPIDGQEGMTLNQAGLDSPAKDATRFKCLAYLKTNASVIASATVSLQQCIYVWQSHIGADVDNPASDSNDGSDPDHAVLTLKRAYELADGDAVSPAQNTIVIIGEYTEDKGGIYQYARKDYAKDNITEFNKPATISGGKSTLAENWNGQELERGSLQIAGYKYLSADTNFENLTFQGINTEAYIYCQGYNLNMGEGLLMQGFSVRNDLGLIPGSNATDFHIVGGFLDWNEDNTSSATLERIKNNPCNITIKSGSYARIIACQRNSKDNTTSHNIFGNKDYFFTANVVVDVPEDNPKNASNYDIGMLCGGQTDGSVYAAATTTLKNGKVGILLGSSIGFGRDMEGDYPNNDFVGVAEINILGGEIYRFYGGCLGRTNDNIVCDTRFLSNSTIRQKENARRAQSNDLNLKQLTKDIQINISGGVIHSDVYAAGSGAMTGRGTISNADTGTYNVSNAVNIGMNVTGGTIEGNVYGGGYGAAKEYITPDLSAPDAGVVYGSSEISIMGGTVAKNVYGAGKGYNYNANNRVMINKLGQSLNALAVFCGDTKVSVGGNAVIGGSVFGAGEGIASASETASGVTYSMKSMAALFGNSRVTVQGGAQIGGSVYGGAENAIVGQGDETSQDVTLEKKTSVAIQGEWIQTEGDSYQLKSPQITGNVFAAGKGVEGASDTQAAIKGAVFGQAEAYVYAGTIGGSIFGGGNESRVYSSEAKRADLNYRTCKVVVNPTGTEIRVNSEADSDDPGKVVDYGGIQICSANANNSAPITIGGSIFGGGNISASSAFTAAVNAVYGNTGVYVKGKDISFSGNGSGVYGDGNMTLVEGNRTITLIDFKNDGSGDDAMKAFYSLQRANRAILDNTSIYTYGALDATDNIDSTKYSINAIDELKMYNGSTLQLDTVVKNLGGLWSDVEANRNFRNDKDSEPGSAWYGTDGNDESSEMSAYRKAYEQYLETGDAQWNTGGLLDAHTYSKLNTISINNGTYLSVSNEEVAPQFYPYGPVTGLFTLKLKDSNTSSGGAFVYGQKGSNTPTVGKVDGTSADQIPDSTGHFCCVSKNEFGNWLNIRTRQNDDFRMWYIKSNHYDYDLDVKALFASNTNGVTKDVTAYLPIDLIEEALGGEGEGGNEGEGTENAGKYTFTFANNQSGVNIVSPASMSAYPAAKTDTPDNPGVKQISFQMAIDGNFTNGTPDTNAYTFASSDTQGTMIDDEGQTVPASFTVDANGRDTIPVTFRMTLGSDLDNQNGTVEFTLQQGENTYTFKLNLTLEKMDAQGTAAQRIGEVYNRVSSPLVKQITKQSAWTAEFDTTYCPMSYGAQGVNLQLQVLTGSLNKGTKVTLLDLTNASSPQYYTYTLPSNLYVNNTVDLSKFVNMYTGESYVNARSSTLMRERLVFIFDYEEADNQGNCKLRLNHKYGNNKDVLSYTPVDAAGNPKDPVTPPALEQKVGGNPQNSISLTQATSNYITVDPTYTFDVYHYNLSYGQNGSISDTRSLDRKYSVRLWLDDAQDYPMGTKIVAKKGGTELKNRYIEDFFDNSDRAVTVVNTNASSNATINIEVWIPRYLENGRYTTLDTESMLNAQVSMVADGAYSSADGDSFFKAVAKAGLYSSSVLPEVSCQLKTDLRANGEGHVDGTIAVADVKAPTMTDYAPDQVNGSLAADPTSISVYRNGIYLDPSSYTLNKKETKTEEGITYTVYEFADNRSYEASEEVTYEVRFGTTVESVVFDGRSLGGN